MLVHFLEEYLSLYVVIYYSPYRVLEWKLMPVASVSIWKKIIRVTNIVTFPIIYFIFSCIDSLPQNFNLWH